MSNPCSFRACPSCKGRGARVQRHTRQEERKRARDEADSATGDVNSCTPLPNDGRQQTQEQQPKKQIHYINCNKCSGCGLVSSPAPPPINPAYPHVAIVGAGIGGSALAVACLHRGIPFTLFERDTDFDARSQGYGLTLQQASKAMAGLGVSFLVDGIRSTRHVVHTTEGRAIGEWGMRRWVPNANTDTARGGDSVAGENTSETVALSAPPSTAAHDKRSNVHIARQSLRKVILGQLGDALNTHVKWGHQLVGFEHVGAAEHTHDGKEGENGSGVVLRFEVNGEEGIKEVRADLLVGADGIRSAVRRLHIGDARTPLRYLGCMVILGICPLPPLLSQFPQLANDERLDSRTVFQTADGTTRIYVMPFTEQSVMWQLSFPIDEGEAKALNIKGATALREEAIRRMGEWHSPIPEMVSCSDLDLISGYPAYDRGLSPLEFIEGGGGASGARCLTFIGDAAHPMSPFKGQGANQAILDALNLARKLATLSEVGPSSPSAATADSSGVEGLSEGLPAYWRRVGIQKAVLEEFEAEMIERTTVKVADSAAAAHFLHSETVLVEGDMPRGSYARRE